MKTTPEISVILPVYNAASTVGRCMESILAQTFRNFELLVVDDGSNDGSGEMCDGFAARDNRIKVIHQANAGVSAARNRALDSASGRYICFVDADDWAEERYLETFFAHGHPEEGGMVIQNCVCDYVSHSRYKFDYPERFFPAEDLPQAMHDVVVECINPFAKLYDGDIIRSRGIRFDERLSSGEDMIFLLEYFPSVRSLRYLPAAHYHYSLGNPGSLSRKIFPFAAESVYFDRMSGLYRNLLSLGFYYKDYQRFAGHVMHHLLRSIYLGGRRKPFCERLSILRRYGTGENIECLKMNDRSCPRLLNTISVKLYSCRLFVLYDAYMLTIVSVRGLMQKPS